jgi:excisionase family DNA binding protein
MSPSKSTPKPTPRKLQSLEGAILQALSHAGSAPNAKAPAAKTRPAKSADESIGHAAAAEMIRHARKLREQLAKFGLVQVETVRFRRQGLADRRLVVEYAPDPEDAHAVLLRVRPASPLSLPEATPRMLTTQQAADRLNVSRPYVAQLVDNGTFNGIERTQSGHRRIPVAEVERVQQQMQSTRRTALDDIADATQDLRAQELADAKSKSKRRWVAKRA